MNRSIIRHITQVLFIILFSMILCACAGTSSGDKTTVHTSFTDALGREITLDSAPKRTAALLGSFADIWMLSGGELCAAASDAWDDFGLELDSAVNLGGAHSPSLELLLSSSPDFVLASASTASNLEICTILESAGITVAYFDVDSFDDYLNMLNICTDITGRKDLYKINGTDIKDRIEHIKSELTSADIGDECLTVLLLRTSSGGVKAKGSEGTVLGEMLDDFGCINIADSERGILEDLSIESIIKNEPYRIFAVTMGDDTDAAMSSLYRLFSENSAWNTLDAVKNGRLHVMDRKLFNLKPNSRWAVAYEKLYEILTKN